MARILHIEDHVPLANTLKELLSGEGHVVDHAPHTPAAKHMLSQGQYDLILSDNNLGAGYQKGTDFIRELHDKTEGQHPPVIMFTSDEWQELVKEGGLAQKEPIPGAAVAGYVSKLDDNKIPALLALISRFVPPIERSSEGVSPSL